VVYTDDVGLEDYGADNWDELQEPDGRRLDNSAAQVVRIEHINICIEEG
jgi:hypothetical protein